MMGLIESGIENVRVFELPAGIWVNGECVASPRVVLLKWRTNWSDKFYQVYVNGRYAGATVGVGQRQMLVHIPGSLESPVRIEVFAVEPEQANMDFSEELDNPAGLTGRVIIKMLRGQDLPIDATVQIYYDAGSGQIDYDHPINKRPIPVWPCRQDKAGFGMGRFGLGDFGYDCSAAVGFGKGCFGYGQFGIDANVLEWTSAPLEAGEYKFAVRVFDQAGNESGGSESEPVTVTPLPKPIEQVSILEFDNQTNHLVLGIL